MQAPKESEGKDKQGVVGKQGTSSIKKLEQTNQRVVGELDASSKEKPIGQEQGGVEGNIGTSSTIIGSGKSTIEKCLDTGSRSPGKLGRMAHPFA